MGTWWLAGLGKIVDTRTLSSATGGMGATTSLTRASSLRIARFNYSGIMLI
jgi:hypothetical protein